MIRTRSFWVGLVMLISATATAKDYAATVSQASLNEPNFQVVAQAEPGVFRVSFSSQDAKTFTLRIKDEKGHDLHWELVRDSRKMAKVYRLQDVPVGTYTFLAVGKGWRLQKSVRVLPSEIPIQLELETLPGGSRFRAHVDGLNESGAYIRILDAHGDELLNEWVEFDASGDRIFNLTQLAIPYVSVSVYYKGVVVVQGIALK